MPDFNETLKSASQAILHRELSEKERTEFLELGAALGMNNVEDYLYILMVFKRHSDVFDKRFDELRELDHKINDTLKDTIERILGEGAKRIGADIGEAVADGARETLTSVGAYHSVRGQTIIICLMSLTSIISYWLGANSFLNAFAGSELGVFDALMFFPAGWSIFLCGVIYTFFWVGDHWEQVRETKLYKTLLGLQVFLLMVLAVNLL